MRSHWLLQAVNKQGTVRERDFPEPRTYIAYVLHELYVLPKLTVFSVMKNQHKIHLMNQVFNVLSHKQVAPPIIKAYADQYTRARRQGHAHQLSRLMSTNAPARGVNSGFSIGLGVWTPKVRSFQDVHRPRGSFSDKTREINFTYTFSLSCLQNKIFWNATPNHLTFKSVLLHRDVRLSFSPYFETC